AMANLKEEAIFDAARAIAAPEARRQYVRQACGDDPALQARVEGLLRMQDEERAFLESPAPGLRDTVANVVREGPGARIGPYQLVETLGEGGFGVVFLAAQQHPVRRQAALTGPRPGMQTRRVGARFDGGRQALAIMGRPNMAKVLDGGTPPSRRPYIVMELVKGIPITDFCDHNRSPRHQRLALLLPVGQAVQHAHQKAIIHRD